MMADAERFARRSAGRKQPEADVRAVSKADSAAENKHESNGKTGHRKRFNTMQPLAAVERC